MQPGDIGVIVNPNAAGGRGVKSIPGVTAALSGIGAPFSLVTTTGPGHATRLAAEMADAGAERIIAVGGDGTFNEVANGLMSSNRPIPMGIVPTGTGCDLPRTLRLPNASLKESTVFAATAGPRIIDLGKARCDSGAERYFLNVAGLGFDATVAERVTRTKLPSAKVSYLAATAISLVNYRNIPVTVVADGVRIDNRAVFVTIANARFFGGGFNITPMADISDGLLDLAIIGDLGMFELLTNIPSVYRGRHTNHRKFTHIPVKHVRITSESTALVQVDGEILGSAPVEFSVQPSAFAVIA
ncbi:MAG: diacylglycerol kinase family lipid kinase [Thermomicrobiales bacterium]